MSEARDRKLKAAQKPEKDAPKPVDLCSRFALSVEEAAVAFAISEPHLRNLLPEIPHVHLGTRVVIPVKLAEEWLRDRTGAEIAGSNSMAEEVIRELNKK